MALNVQRVQHAMAPRERSLFERLARFFRTKRHPGATVRVDVSLGINGRVRVCVTSASSTVFGKP